MLCVAAPGTGRAVELSSASYRHLGGEVAAAAASGDRALASSVVPSAFGAADATVGAAPFAAPSGSLGTLTSMLPGFVALVTAGFPSLDLDGDLAQFFLDEDDDGDGLDDVHETNTGSFVSPTNTGTSPTNADSDGDGFEDGVEVQAGSDPNDFASRPAAPGVPGLVLPIQLLLFVILVTVGGAALGWRPARAERA